MKYCFHGEIFIKGDGYIEEKKCIDCQIVKPISEFYKNTNRCKVCSRLKSIKYHEQNKNNPDYISKRRKLKHEYDLKNKSTKSGWYSKIYNNMKQRNKKKFGKSLPFSKEEFVSWIDKNYKERFNDLFQKYVDSGCDKYLVPSIDRIDDYDSYHFGNMQLLTWKQNDVKGTNGIKNKVSCAEVGKKYCSKTVVQYDENMNEIMRFSSTHEVTRILGFDSSLIAKACREGFKSKGYYWKYI